MNDDTQALRRVRVHPAGHRTMRTRYTRRTAAAAALAALAIPVSAHASFLPPELMDKAAMYLAWFVIIFVPIGGIVLFWRVKDGEVQSPLGPLLARASAEGYTKDKRGPTPYHGYYFRLLKGQGASAKSGALDYTVRGRTIGGFAAVAYPANYGNTGIMSFIINQDGTVYEKDLGPDTRATGLKLQRFDPGPGWSPVPAR